MKLISRNKRKGIFQCTRCDTIEELSYYSTIKLSEITPCAECRLELQVWKRFNELNSQENGIYIVKLLPNKMCIAKCMTCNNQYERSYRSGIFIEKCCKNCTIKVSAGKNQKHPIVNKYHRLFRIFNSMHQRTTNPKNSKYDYYGGQGITICDEWLQERTKFYDWALLNGYSDELTIDRNDNDLGYSPDNCSWKTMTEQQRNTRQIQSNCKTGFRGVSSSNVINNPWRTRITVDNLQINIGYYNTVLEAAQAYNTYCDEHNLSHTRNII